jgi:curved DNA-binding protein CbpA
VRPADSDPYALLGIPRDAPAADVTRAYRRAARATHPDAQAADPSAADRFRNVTNAYETLRDPARRAAYDRAHPVVRTVVVQRAFAAGEPPPARAGPRPDAAAAPLRFAAPLAPRPASTRPAPLDAGGPPRRVRQRYDASAADDELLQLVTALSRLLRSGRF